MAGKRALFVLLALVWVSTLVAALTAPDVNITAVAGSTTTGGQSFKFGQKVLLQFNVLDPDATPGGEELKLTVCASLFALDLNASNCVKDMNLLNAATHPTADFNASSLDFSTPVTVFYKYNTNSYANLGYDKNYFFDVNVTDSGGLTGTDSTPTQLLGTESGLASAWNLNRDDSNVIRAWDANATGAKHGELVNGPRWDMNIVQTPVEGFDLNFDGVNDYVNLPGAAILGAAGAASVSAWVNPSTGFSSNYGAIYYVSDATHNNYFWIQTLVAADGGAGEIRFGGKWPAQDYVQTSGFPIAANKWTFVTGVYDGAKILIYENGIQVASKAETGTLLSDSGITKNIGNGGNYSQNFLGKIDSVNLWNTALTQTQIWQQSGANEIIGAFTDSTAPANRGAQPTAGSVGSRSSVDINATITDDYNIQSVTVKVNGSAANGFTYGTSCYGSGSSETNRFCAFTR